MPGLGHLSPEHAAGRRSDGRKAEESSSCSDSDEGSSSSSSSCASSSDSETTSSSALPGCSGASSSSAATHQQQQAHGRHTRAGLHATNGGAGVPAAAAASAGPAPRAASSGTLQARMEEALKRSSAGGLLPLCSLVPSDALSHLAFNDSQSCPLVMTSMCAHLSAGSAAEWLDPERDDGNTEYKLRLKDPSPVRFQQLVCPWGPHACRCSSAC